MDNTLPITNVTVADESMDMYSNSGVYYFSSSYTPMDIPVGVNGWLINLRANSTTKKQIWMRHGTADTNSYNTYERLVSDSTVGGWTKYITENDLPTTEYNGIDSNTHYGVTYDGKVVFISLNGTTPSGTIDIIKTVGKYPLRTTTFPIIILSSSIFYLGYIYLGSSSSTVSVRSITSLGSSNSQTTLDSNSTATVYGHVTFVCK